MSSFWKQDQVDQIIKAASLQKNCYFPKMSQLSDDPEDMALGKFKNAGVAKHPSDKVMDTIAQLIWKEIVVIMEY